MIHQKYVSTINVRKLKTIKKLFKLHVTKVYFSARYLMIHHRYVGIHYKLSGTKYYQELRNVQLSLP